MPQTSFRRLGMPGFTFLEILIVLVILGILASIVIVKVGDEMPRTREVAVKGNLSVLRTQITSYQVQHAYAFPPGDRLADSLVGLTDLAGNAATAATDPRYGPYLTYIPPNPINHLNTIKVVPAGATLAPDDTTGWLYQSDNTSFFKVMANTTQLDSRGRPIADY